MVAFEFTIYGIDFPDPEDDDKYFEERNKVITPEMQGIVVSAFEDLAVLFNKKIVMSDVRYDRRHQKFVMTVEHFE